MITALRKEYYWLGMKKYVADYLARCLEFQQIKAEHQHPAGLLQPLPIPEWKWENISMDFIMDLPKSWKNNDSIMVVVDKLSKAAHFIPVKSTYRAMQIAHIFMQNIFKLHGLPKVNQVLEDMLRAYVMQQSHQWEDYIHLVEFAYNNGYHTSLQMSPFEVLYGRKCRTPSSWGGPEDKLVLGLEMLQEMERLVKRIHVNLKAAQDRQKKFADRKRRFKQYQVSDHVYVESEGEIRVKPLSILDRREVTLRKWDITQVKVQWQHFGHDEATWEDEELMKKTYVGLFMAGKHRDDVQSQGGKM
eukprot:PITA_21602